MKLARHAAAACALAAGLAACIAAAPAWAGAPAAAPLHFKTLDDAADPTFNELLGVNNLGQIAGYYGSGLAFHPNKGYLLMPPYGQPGYRREVFPGSVQTQVTGLNDVGVSVGFLSYTNDANPANNASYGFWARAGGYHKVVFPAGGHRPQVSRLLGVNNHGTAAGFYLDATGNAHGFLYAIATRRFALVPVPGAVSVVAAAVSNRGAVAGYFVTAGGGTKGFLRRANGSLVVLAKPGADATQAFGVNDLGEVVGSYTVGSAFFGFTWTAGGGFATVSDPSGAGSTVVNGVNNAGDLVGYYVGGGGNTNGMLVTP